MEWKAIQSYFTNQDVVILAVISIALSNTHYFLCVLFTKMHWKTFVPYLAAKTSREIKINIFSIVTWRILRLIGLRRLMTTISLTMSDCKRYIRNARNGLQPTLEVFSMRVRGLYSWVKSFNATLCRHLKYVMNITRFLQFQQAIDDMW